MNNNFGTGFNFLSHMGAKSPFMDTPSASPGGGGQQQQQQSNPFGDFYRRYLAHTGAQGMNQPGGNPYGNFYQQQGQQFMQQPQQQPQYQQQQPPQYQPQFQMGGQQPNLYGGGGLGTGMSNSLYGQQQPQMGAYKGNYDMASLRTQQRV